jgi:hypothetical protein
MENNTRLLIFLAVFIGACVFFATFKPQRKPILVQPPIQQPIVPIPPAPPPPTPEIPNISNPVPSYQSYSEMIEQLREWQREAPDLVYEVGTYGKTSKGKDIYFMRFGNKYQPDKLKCLLTAAIHGNESIASSTMMAFCGTLLSKYGKDDRVTELLNTREIVLVPSVSPDSYPSSRHVDGVDPNRNFPSKRNPNVNSVAPVRELMEFHLKERFKSCLMGHSWGRWYLYSWSEIKEKTPHDADYQRILDKMLTTSSGYKKKQSAYFYPGQTIVGGGCDWFYRNGCLAMTPEFGEHQRKSTDGEIQKELGLTYDAFVYWLEEAPKVDVPVIDPQYRNAYWLEPYTPFDPIPE